MSFWRRIDPSRGIKKIGEELDRIGKDIDKEARRVGRQIDKETRRVLKDAETAVRKTRDALKEAGDDIAKETERVSGIDIKPIIKAIAGPAHILAKIGEGKNLSDAATDWVVSTIEGGGELAGVLGSDAEKAVETLISAAQMPVLILSNLAGDTITVAEGKEDISELPGSGLAGLIRQAHALYNDHAQPLPMELRLILSGIVDAKTLKRARFVIDRTPNNVAGLANALNADGDHNHAVTIGDIIVFAAPPPKTVNGYAHWVHELKHVEQYDERGILEFAADYLKNYKAIEEEAVAAAIAAETVLASKLELLG